MRQFSTIWFGQLVSIIGTSITRFALIIYVYSLTESATSTVLIAFFSMLPFVIASLFSGVIIDKYSRKKIMIITDIIAALCTMLLFISFQLGVLTLPIIYLCQVITGFSDAFQTPAYTSSISVLIPTKHFKRANAMRNFSQSASKLIAPVMAGVLFGLVGLQGILIIDIVTFMVGIGLLLFVKIPMIVVDESLQKISINTFKESIKKSWKLINSIAGLRYLMISFVIINFLSGITYFGILPIYILAQTDNDTIALGLVEFSLGLGGFVGSILVFLLPKTKSKTKTIYIFMLLSFIIGDLFLAFGYTVTMWSIAAFLSSICTTFIIVNEIAIWQEKTPINMQGRIFSLKYSINLFTLPLGYIVGGLLADYVFKPLINSTTDFASILRTLFGMKSGNEIAVMFFLSGLIGIIVSLLGLFSKNIHSLEKTLEKE